MKEEDKKIMMQDTLSMHIDKVPTDHEKEGEEESDASPPANSSKNISLDT